MKEETLYELILDKLFKLDELVDEALEKNMDYDLMVDIAYSLNGILENIMRDN
jgi:hypothetical protein